jgi:hypothetical protein
MRIGRTAIVGAAIAATTAGTVLVAARRHGRTRQLHH